MVTGGANGIGRAIALKLADQGAAVMIADTNKDAAIITAAEIEEISGSSAVHATDVTNFDLCTELAALTVDSFGPVDILVNNAGIAGSPGWQGRPFSTEEDCKLTYQVNVIGISNITSAFRAQMEKRRSGRIVNIASIAGREGRPGLPHYSASKAAVISLTQSTALEFAPLNIRVNAICPGPTASRMLEGIPDEWVNSMVAAIPLGRVGQPEEVAKTSLFLASDDSSFFTGQTLAANGGSHMI